MPPNKFNLSEINEITHDVDDGHDICYTFSLHNAAAISRQFTLTQNHIISCPGTPSSWKFTMTLHRNSNSGAVSGEVKLERLQRILHPNLPDLTLYVPIVTHCVLTFRHEDFSLDFTLGNQGYRTFLPGTVKKGYIETIVPNECQDLLRGEIFIKLSVFVRNCHRTFW